MADGPEFPPDPDAEPALSGLDGERPLPPELTARLEAALLAAVAGGLPVPSDAESLDAARPLPEPLRARLESALLAETAAGGTVSPLETRRGRRAVAVWSPAAAAVLLLVIAVAALVGRGGSGAQHVAVGPTTSTAGAPVSVPSGTGAEPALTTPAGEATAATVPPATTATTRSARPAPTPTTRATNPAPVAPGPATTAPTSPTPGPGSTTGGSSDPGPAPPFYDSAPSRDAAPTMSAQPATPAPSGGSSGGAAPPNQTTAAPAGPPLRVGIVTGDAAQEAGFRAYIDRVNSSGGVRGHSIQLVTAGPGSPAAGTIATVNLSTLPVAGPGGAPSWANGPLLETLTATENLLPGTGAVFSFASPPERQGHLAADALFPAAVTDKPGPTAVIYAGSAEPFATAVPNAMRAVLEPRGVKVVVSPYDPAHNKTALDIHADAALLSLDPAAAKAWVAQAKQAAYHPARGLAGIYSLADDTLAPDLPEGARVVSPYAAPSGDEAQAIRSGAGGTSAPVLHGWVSAKALAAAIWRTGADTPAEMQTALEGLAGWSPGLAPAYETRSGTRARTPEGLVFAVQSGAFVPQGGFRRDPF